MSYVKKKCNSDVLGSVFAKINFKIKVVSHDVQAILACTSKMISMHLFKGLNIFRHFS